jgi:translocation and assembly module TamA
MRPGGDRLRSADSGRRHIARLGACLALSVCLGAVSAPAAAFELFGVHLFGKRAGDDAVVDPLHFTLTFEPGTEDGDLADALREASIMRADEKRPVSGSLGLLAKARSEREALVAALYAEARYDGVVDILIQGRPLDEIPLDAQFDRSQPVPVTVSVRPGRVFVLGEIELRGEVGGLMPARYGLIAGGDAGSTAILAAEAKMVRSLKEEGRPLARVTSREIVADHDTGTLDVALTFAAGPVATYGATTVTGTQDVDNSFVAYMAGLEPGKTYSPQDMDDARERLVALDVFNSVTVSEADALDPAGAIPIDVTVSERKHRYFGVGATYSSTDGGGVEGYWGHRNLFGHAEKLRIEGSISRIGVGSSFGQLNYNAGIMFEKPGVLGPTSKFISSIKGNFEHPNAFEKLSVDARAGIRYELTRKQTVSGEVRLEWSRITDSFSPVVPVSHLLASIPLEYVYDGRDNRLDPTKGIRFLVNAEPAHDFYTGATFVRLQSEASAYKSFGEEDRVVLAGRVAAGSILGAPLAVIPADRRFYSGGGGSVRGYAYQGIGPVDAAGIPTGGLSFAETSVELRIKVSDKFGIVPFVDAGTVSATTLPNFSTVRFGAGLGIRYLTPLGPLRIDAAVPLNRRPGDPSFGVYAGIGQAF